MNYASCHPERRHHAKGMCEACYKRRWAEGNRDKTRTASIRYRLSNPDKVKQRCVMHYVRYREKIREYHKMHNSQPETQKENKSRKLLKRYGITLEHYEELLREQHGACAVCGKTDGFGGIGHNLRVDHDHGENKVRGLLCNRCNTGLGYIENMEWFDKALAYLLKYKDINEASVDVVGSSATGRKICQ